MGARCVKAHNTEFIITRQAILYLARTMDLKMTPFFVETEIPGEIEGERRELLDALALQIQRSVDYYQSQLHQVPPGRVFISSGNQAIAAYLAPQLACEVKSLELPKFLATEMVLTAETARNLVC